MKPDLSSFSVDELNAFIIEAQALIATKKEEEIQKAYAEFAQKAAALGVSLDELVAKGGKGGRKAAAVAGVVTARKPVAIRYRDPANPSDTWTGRGKQPRWLVARLASGARLEDFAV